MVAGSNEGMNDVQACLTQSREAQAKDEELFFVAREPSASFLTASMWAHMKSIRFKKCRSRKQFRNECSAQTKHEAGFSVRLTQFALSKGSNRFGSTS